MYGNLRPATVTRAAPDIECMPPSQNFSSPTVLVDISWQLVLLVCAEFLAFATVVVPLLPHDEYENNIETFWDNYSWIAAATCVPYILLTLPVAVGYTWFVQGWPLNAITWMVIVCSLASVVHIASVATDPRGVFLGCCSISLLLCVLSLLRLFDKLSFSKSPIAFVLALIWQSVVFLPIYFVGALGPYSTLGSAVASVICSVCLIAEFRLIENQTSVPMESPTRTDEQSQPRSNNPASKLSKSFSSLKSLTVQDPFTMSVWVNCASWRFLFQSVILAQKIFLQFL